MGIHFQSTVAGHKGDPFILSLFKEAGWILGRMCRTLVSQFSTEDSTGVLQIIAVGSVWKSFDLFRDSFVKAFKGTSPPSPHVTAFELVRLKVPSTTGAAWAAAKVRLCVFENALNKFMFSEYWSFVTGAWPIKC